MAGSRLLAASSATRRACTSRSGPGSTRRAPTRAPVAALNARPFDLAGISNLEREQLPPPLLGRGFDRLPRQEAEPSIPEDRHWRRTWGELLEQLESLPRRLCRLKAQPREVPARACEALNKPLAHRVAGARHDDGDRRGRLLERGQHWPSGDDHVDPETDQLSRQVREALPPDHALGARRGAPLDQHPHLRHDDPSVTRVRAPRNGPFHKDRCTSSLASPSGSCSGSGLYVGPRMNPVSQHAPWRTDKALRYCSGNT